MEYDNEKSLSFKPKKYTELEVLKNKFYDNEIEIMDNFDKYNDEKIKYFDETIQSLHYLPFS